MRVTDMGARGPKPGFKRAQTAQSPESSVVMQNESETTNTQPVPATLTPEQQAIAARITAQSADDEWLHLREDELNDFSLSKNPFDLPKEAKKLQDEKRYAFRFCTRTPSRVDQLTRSQTPPLRWGIVNSVQVPELAHLVDPITGGVCVADQILLFKPWSHHERVKAAKENLARGASQAQSLEGAASKLSSPDGKITAETGPQHKIGGRDVVMQAEDPIDLRLPAETIDAE